MVADRRWRWRGAIRAGRSDRCWTNRSSSSRSRVSRCRGVPRSPASRSRNDAAVRAASPADMYRCAIRGGCSLCWIMHIVQRREKRGVAGRRRDDCRLLLPKRMPRTTRDREPNISQSAYMLRNPAQQNRFRCPELKSHISQTSGVMFWLRRAIRIATRSRSSATVPRSPIPRLP
ncbi:hypothetical protein QO004_005960 [Rhizobium mesoamericanum]|nr:hypothetical protein [Rhizobium mesoamericanum]